MGDRVLMQCHNSKTGEFGPVIYCHWAGRRVPVIVRALVARVRGKTNDLPYVSARLLQEAIDITPGNVGATGFGIENAEFLLIKEDNPDDAGVVLIDVANDFRCVCMGGYLGVDPEGFPYIPQLAI